MQIHQIVVSASPADAVTNDALETRRLLRRIGPSQIFARYIHEVLAGDVLPLEEYAARPSARRGQDILVYHASIGEPSVLSFIMERRERLIVKYHNITPARYFAELDPAFAALLTGGRDELAALRPRAALALAVSHYNAKELEDIGYSDVRVSPLLADVGELRGQRPHPGAVNHFRKFLKGPLILFVGQLMPHKRPDLLLQSYHALVTHLVPDAYLAMVGSSPMGRYREAIHSFARELNLVNAWIPGRVPPSVLAAYFQQAAVFVTASEHEGFCVPLVEAMAFEVPVLARSFAAIPETVGDAALLLPSDEDPLLIAEALAYLLSDGDLRRDLTAAGSERLSRYDADGARATFLTHLGEVA